MNHVNRGHKRRVFVDKDGEPRDEIVIHTYNCWKCKLIMSDRDNGFCPKCGYSGEDHKRRCP